jgi:hypothetical protein
MNNETHCPCGKAFADDATNFLPGYARRAADDVKVCYPCAAAGELADMHATGRATLYITGDEVVKYKGPGVVAPVSHLDNVVVGNWTGHFQFKVTSRWYGSHNIAGTRTDVRFRDDQGAEWWGVTFGNNTQLIHCKRLKGRA